jgi:hypothetical protein
LVGVCHKATLYVQVQVHMERSCITTVPASRTANVIGMMTCPKGPVEVQKDDGSFLLAFTSSDPITLLTAR